MQATTMMARSTLLAAGFLASAPVLAADWVGSRTGEVHIIKECSH